MWLTVKQVAEHLGVSEKTVRRRIKKGEWETKESAFDHGVRIMVQVGHPEVGQVGQVGQSRLDKVGQVGQVGHPEVDRLDTSEPEKIETQHIEKWQWEELTAEQEKYALARASLVTDIEKIISKHESKLEGWESAYNMYLNKMIGSNSIELEGSKSERTLRRWIKTYLESGRDYRSLAPVRGKKAEHSVPAELQRELLSLLLHPNRLSKSSAIEYLGLKLQKEGGELPCSKRTLLRWINSWEKRHRAEWTLAREGQKAYRDKIGMLITRDQNALEVGDVCVIDGHTLNFRIVDPKTGKPRRMTLIMCYDWASRMPVGCSINLTENTESILLAVRAAVINYGFAPRILYIDNGKAFRAKIFNKKPEQDLPDLAEELPGLFYRLGSEPVFATPYNARAKVVERYFHTMNENFERFICSFSGASIGDKPATMKRNEKWISKLKDRKPITIEDFKMLFNMWIYEYYGKREHRGLEGNKPLEIFQEGVQAVDRSRIIHPRELQYLLMSENKIKITNKGIRLFGMQFWAEELVGMAGDLAYVQYDIMDMRRVWVYREGRRGFVCVAERDNAVHPMYRLADAKSKSEVEKKIRQQRSIEKKHRKLTETLMERVSDESSLFDSEAAEQGRIFREDYRYLPGGDEDKEIDLRKLENQIPEKADEDKEEVSELAELLKTMGL